MEHNTKTCTKCGIEKELSNFGKNKNNKDGLKYICKDCSKEYYTNYRNREDRQYNILIKERWASINQRTSNGKYTTSFSAMNSPQFKSYREKGIELNMTKDEFTSWMLSMKDVHDKIVESGDKSSIDRINSEKGYSIDNIKMIPLHENIENRYGRKLEKTGTSYTAKLSNKNRYQKCVKNLKMEM